jgi:transposase
MMLSKTEKEQRVIELYQQGKTIREIAQEVHMSFGNIGSIIRKFTGIDDAKSKEQQDKVQPAYPKIPKLSHCFQMVKSLLMLPLN